MSSKFTQLTLQVVRVSALLAIVFMMMGTAQAKSTVTDITQQELLDILARKGPKDSYALIDVRTPEEFKAGHIASSINIPHQFILKNISLLDPYLETNMIFYCQSGRRVSLVTDLLTDLDYENLFHLDGDFIAWRNKRLAISHE